MGLRFMNSLVVFLKEFCSFSLVRRLAINDLKSRYAGSFFGIAWAVVQPMITICVFWYVFQVGFRSAPVNKVPFILWFASAYIPWCFFSDALMSGSNCLYEYNFLIKKIKFPVAVLPLVKIGSSMLVHFFFIGFLFLIFLIYGSDFKLIWFQSLYYSFSLTCLLISLSLISSSLSVFFKDFGQIINIFLQIGFWLTPIFWSPEAMSSKILKTIKLNPLYYITQGYRDSFIYDVPFYAHWELTLYFWILTIVLFVFGIKVFQKLRPHFADLL